jgi:hypothetical protein
MEKSTTSNSDESMIVKIMEICFLDKEGKVFPVLNEAPCHEDISIA